MSTNQLSANVNSAVNISFKVTEKIPRKEIQKFPTQLEISETCVSYRSTGFPQATNFFNAKTTESGGNDWFVIFLWKFHIFTAAAYLVLEWFYNKYMHWWKLVCPLHWIINFLLFLALELLCYKHYKFSSVVLPLNKGSCTRAYQFINLSARLLSEKRTEQLANGIESGGCDSPRGGGLVFAESSRQMFIRPCTRDKLIPFNDLGKHATFKRRGAARASAREFAFLSVGSRISHTEANTVRTQSRTWFLVTKSKQHTCLCISTFRPYDIS